MFFQSTQEPIADAKNLFQFVLDSFKTLSFSENELQTVLSLIGAVVHLGRAGAVSNQTKGAQFRNPDDAQKAASLLGVSLVQLGESIFTVNTTVNTSTNGKSSSRVSPDPTSSSQLSPIECLQGFCIGLYQECLNLIVNLINRSFKPVQASGSNRASFYYHHQSVSNSMLVIDPPGFQSSSNSSASYADLICNYLTERLQLMFYQINFINPIEKCAQEGLGIDLVEHIPESPSALVNWFDKPPSNLQRNAEAGLLWLIDEQVNAETKSPLNFLSRLVESDQKQNFLTVNSDSDTSFIIHHQFGQFPVEYNVDEWLENYCKEFSVQRNVASLLLDSKKDAISTSIK